MFKRQFKASDVEKYAPSTLCINRVWLSEEPPQYGDYQNYARLEIDWVCAEHPDAMNANPNRYWIEYHFRTHDEMWSDTNSERTLHVPAMSWHVAYDGDPEGLVKLASIIPYLPKPNDDNAQDWAIAPNPHSTYSALSTPSLDDYDVAMANRQAIRKALDRWSLLVQRQKARSTLQYEAEQADYEAKRAANQS